MLSRAKFNKIEKR